MPTRTIYTPSKELLEGLRDDHRRLAGYPGNSARQSRAGGARHLGYRPGVLFKNTSSEAVPKWGLMAVVGGSERLGDIVVDIDKPTTTFYRQVLVNGPVEVGSSAEGTAQAPGGVQTVFYATDDTPAVGDSLGPSPGTWAATKGFPSVCNFIVSINTTELYAAVSPLHDVDSMIGKTTAAVTTGATTAYSIWSSSGMGFKAVTTFDRPQVFASVDISSGLQVKLTWYSGGWIMEQLECNP